MAHGDAVNLIRNGNGSHFDPELVELFLKHEKEFEQVSLNYIQMTKAALLQH
jgi:response regulator RpfG family c-di-GMP phosphodiesterase